MHLRIKKHQHDSQKSLTRCLLANFRDRVLQASALDDTQNSLNTKTEGNSLGGNLQGPPIRGTLFPLAGPIEIPILQGILNGSLGVMGMGVPLLGVPGISWWACGCEGGKKRPQVGKGQKNMEKKHLQTNQVLGFHVM